MNETRQLTKPGAERLAAFLRTLRTDWDEPGIVAALARAKDRGDAYQIAIAAVRCAGDPTNRTPAVIAMDGRHWRPPTADDPLKPPPTPVATSLDRRCDCGLWVVRGEPHRCAPVGDPAAGAAKAKAAMRGEP